MVSSVDSATAGRSAPPTASEVGISPWLSDLILNSQSDERLVSLARAGHERAFTVIVERYRAELYAFARRHCSDQRAEDVLQQAFLSAFDALRGGAEVRHLRGWLYRIVRNATLATRAPHAASLDGVVASGEAVEDLVAQRVLAIQTLSELRRLPDRQREALVGTALQGRGRAELASSMGVTEGALRQLVHRARMSLRSAVTALTPFPLSRWFAAGGPAATPELSLSTGMASAGGVAIKLGALMASGALAAGVAVTDSGSGSHRAPKGAQPGQIRSGSLAQQSQAASLAASHLAPAGRSQGRPVHRTRGAARREFVIGHGPDQADQAATGRDDGARGTGSDRSYGSSGSGTPDGATPRSGDRTSHGRIPGSSAEGGGGSGERGGDDAAGGDSGSAASVSSSGSSSSGPGSGGSDGGTDGSSGGASNGSSGSGSNSPITGIASDDGSASGGPDGTGSVGSGGSDGSR